jgi:5-methyltetrahydrofolate--homocysteine methyltransferase
MATVKGDVHDIGKNIVGVVLGCNNYEVIDLGVMVPCEQILETARRERVDAIGLSGLITPSLDEMVHVAREMQRQGFEVPLLIGGATTSRQHTAVKIAPQYGPPTIHVLDASRAVGTVSSLFSRERRAEFDAANRREQQRLRELHAERRAHPLVAYAKARERGAPIVWRAEDLAHPSFFGLRRIERLPLEELVPYIDWTFFFHAWELRGKFPQILDHPEYGKAARDLYADASRLLDRIVRERLLAASAVYGFWPANADGDDVIVWADEARSAERLRFHFLRQQETKTDEQMTYRSLADYVAPLASGLVDSIGAFAVNAGVGADALVARYEAANDNYGAIIVKALADRLAEAFAEYLHERARRDWGYAKDEHLTKDELIDEKYRGIRPAFGYPACPEHSEKAALFELLAADQIGLGLTEHYAMTPAASVSGLYFAHPAARYFNLGKVNRDQVADYAARKGLEVRAAERLLSTSLAYDPD